MLFIVGFRGMSDSDNNIFTELFIESFYSSLFFMVACYWCQFSKSAITFRLISFIPGSSCHFCINQLAEA